MQLYVPGTLGRLVHLNIVAKWDDVWGWEVVIRHKHRMEDKMCTSVDRYDTLSAHELEQCLGAVVASSHYPHSWIPAENPYCTAEVNDVA